MYLDKSLRRTPSHATVTATDVPLSRWVNERFPPWNEILTSHDVARLTRRHCWILSALSFVGRFPKKRQFRGRPIGWLRTDVDQWLGRHRHRQAPCSKLRPHRLPFRRHFRGATSGCID
jgi:predicted DNA-binding transcriptional regulator AlpA